MQSTACCKSAGADPAPIGLRASHQGRVISVAPDIRYVGARGQNPTVIVDANAIDNIGSGAVRFSTTHYRHKPMAMLRLMVR